MNKLRKSKKAFFLQIPTDIQGWFIFFAGIILWAIVFAAIKTEVRYEITGQVAYLSNDDILLTYLQTPVANQNIADMITKVYFGASDEQLKTEMNIMLNSVYGRTKQVCWKLWGYEQGKETEISLASEKCAGESADILDARTAIPLQNKKPIEIRLIIPGYK